MPPIMKSVMGNKGGGKSLYGAWEVQYVHQYYPKVPIIANTPMTHALHYPDILKFIAMKIISKDPRFVLCEIDEAALAGFEARGSFKAEKAIDSYLIALSRKANLEITILTQLISMIEKRAQWLSDLYILAKSERDEGKREPTAFYYTVYNEDLLEVSSWSIPGPYAKKYLYGKFDTKAIPFEDELAQDFRDRFEIDEYTTNEMNQLVDDYLSRMKEGVHERETYAETTNRLFGKPAEPEPPEEIISRYLPPRSGMVSQGGVNYQVVNPDLVRRDLDDGKYRLLVRRV